MATVNELMTKKVISVGAETPLIEAANILSKYSLNGLPVVDKDNVLVGIVTDYDLIVKGTSIHLPTFIKLMSQIDLYKKDKSLIKDDLRKVLEIKVSEAMNNDPLVLSDGASVEEAVNAFAEHHRVNPIPVIDSQKKVIGILSRHDLNKLLKSSGFFLEGGEKERDIDKEVNSFINNFDREFVFVSKSQTRLWLVSSLISGAVGFIIAWLWVLNFTSLNQ